MMITRESHTAWGYVHFDGAESWAIIARDSESGLYGYARLVRDDLTGEEEICGFEPDPILTKGIASGDFDLTNLEWVD